MGHTQNYSGADSIDTEAARADSKEKLVVKPPSWASYIWDTWDLPKNERWLLFKVDAFVLTFASVSIHLQCYPK
jgi:ACS family pantothenate transporter-like MFS transporter